MKVPAKKEFISPHSFAYFMANFKWKCKKAQNETQIKTHKSETISKIYGASASVTRKTVAASE